jgi:hypothetical protein
MKPVAGCFLLDNRQIAAGIDQESLGIATQVPVIFGNDISVRPGDKREQGAGSYQKLVNKSGHGACRPLFSSQAMRPFHQAHRTHNQH